MITIKQLQTLAQQKDRTLAYIQKLWAIETFLQAFADTIDTHFPQQFLFRGSLILRNWVQPNKRKVEDIDIMGLVPYSLAICEKLVHKTIESMENHPMIRIDKKNMESREPWENSNFPGARFDIPYTCFGKEECLQLDFGFGDTILPAPISMQYQPLMGSSFSIMTVPRELALAWKVHGLFEFWDKGSRWTAKTLYDIYLLLYHCTIDKNIFKDALKVAFEERLTPMEVYKRVLREEFGRSRGSHRNWNRFVEQQGLEDFDKNHLELIEEIRVFLDPFFWSA